MTSIIEYSLEELAKILQVESSGDSSTLITGINTLTNAGNSDLSFYHNPRFAEALRSTEAAIVIIHPNESKRCTCAVLLSNNPYATFAKASQLFVRQQLSARKVHSTACIADDVRLGSNIHIGANVVIESGTAIGDEVTIGNNCVIGRDCRLGIQATLHSNVTLYSEITIGAGSLIHSGTVIGSDGFGYAPDKEKHIKIAQLGGVKIGCDVEVGACCSIDRGTLDDTEIGDGVKIDNQVQIAHNVKVGAHTVICGCSAIAGSSVIGKQCTIAGGVGIINHVNITDNVTITAMSLVSKDIKVSGVYSSGTALSETKQWKKNIVRFKELDKMSKRIEALETSKNSLKNNNCEG